MGAHIHFFSEDLHFRLTEPQRMVTKLKKVIEEEAKELAYLNFIFCSDSYLHALNKKYLEHDTPTDVITFDLSESPDIIAGDVYISIERIADNAVTFAVSEKEELQRVMIHGVLHLAGYSDTTTAARKIMRAREDYYLGQSI